MLSVGEAIDKTNQQPQRTNKILKKNRERQNKQTRKQINKHASKQTIASTKNLAILRRNVRVGIISTPSKITSRKKRRDFLTVRPMTGLLVVTVTEVRRLYLP